MTAALHQQIADDLRTQIESGQLAPGQRLKPEIELRAEYTGILSQPISSKTVQDAIALLISDGLIEVHHDGEAVVVGKTNSAQNRIPSESQGDEAAGSFSEVIDASLELEATTPRVEIRSADTAPELALNGEAQV